MEAPSNLFYTVNDKFRVIVRLTSKAFQNPIVSPAHETDGRIVIKSSVTAAPGAGKANTTSLNLLATGWKLPTSSLSIIKGATTRRKIIEIAKDSQIVEPFLTAWIKRLTNENVYLEN